MSVEKLLLEKGVLQWGTPFFFAMMFLLRSFACTLIGLRPTSYTNDNAGFRSETLS